MRSDIEGATIHQGTSFGIIQGITQRIKRNIYQLQGGYIEMCIGILMIEYRVYLHIYIRTNVALFIS